MLGSPIDVDQLDYLDYLCVGSEVECKERVLRAYDFRRRIEREYLDRPFYAERAGFSQAVAEEAIPKDVLRLVRGRTRQLQLCDKLSRSFGVPELVALAEYLGIDTRGFEENKWVLCQQISAHLSKGGGGSRTQYVGPAPPPTRPASYELVKAVQRNDIGRIKQLLDAGVDPNEPYSTSRYITVGYANDNDNRRIRVWKRVLPLRVATSEGNVDAIKVLLRYSAKPLLADSVASPVLELGYRVGSLPPRVFSEIQSLLGRGVSDIRKFYKDLALGRLVAALEFGPLSAVEAQVKVFQEGTIDPTGKVYDGQTLGQVLEGAEVWNEEQRRDIMQVLTLLFPLPQKEMESSLTVKS